MPLDTKSYQVYGQKYKGESGKVLENLEKCIRDDGRAFDEHRKISMRTGVISQSKGSAYIELGKTKVICSVFDPREIPNRNEFSINGELFCEFKFAPFSFKKRRHVREVDEKEFRINLRQTLNSAVKRSEFPNFQVDICVMVIENDGSSFSAAVVCASLALADAGIPMYDLVTTVSMGIYNGQKLIDPSYEEEIICNNFENIQNDDVSINEHGILMVGYMTTLQQITEIISFGVLSHDRLSPLIDELVKENEKLYHLSRQCLFRGILRDLECKQENELENK